MNWTTYLLSFVEVARSMIIAVYHARGQTSSSWLTSTLEPGCRSIGSPVAGASVALPFCDIFSRDSDQAEFRLFKYLKLN